MTIDEIRIILKVNGAATYTHTINEVTNVTNNYNRSCTSLLSTLAKLVSAGAIVHFGKQCINAASDMEKAQNVIDKSFSNTADTIEEWTKKNAANFGLSDKDAKKNVGSYGLLAKQFNMTEEQAAVMGIKLTELSGDLASFYNMEQKVAANKLNAIFTGDANSLKDFGVIMSENNLSAYALSKGLDVSYDKLSEQAKVVIRYQYAMERLAHVQGDYANNSEKFANSAQNLNVTLDNLKAEIGKELIPVAVTGLQAITGIVQTVSPIIVGVAETIKLYVEAWKNASDETKKFAKIAFVAIGVMIVIPKVVTIVSKAFKVLFIDALTLTTGLQALAGIIGVIFALVAMKKLSESVEEMRNATTGIDSLADSADASTSALDALSDSLDGLGDSSKGLETFLASFDEVNRVGGSTSLMSGLVTPEDLENIFGASLGIEDLQNQLDSLHMPSIIPEGVFTKQFWVDLGADVMGFLDEVFFDPGEFWADWKRGFDIIIDSIESIGDWLDKVAPKWSNFWNKAGFDIHDITHDKNGNPKTVGAMALDALLDDNGKDNSESFTGANGVTYAKYRNDGTLSGAYESYIRSGANKTITNNTTNNTQQPVVYSPNILIDGQKITSVVVDGINAITRSSGNSPLVEMGG